MRDLFRNADFARLFAGRLVTNAGDSLYAVAAMWLVYSLSGSTFYTGLAGFLTMGPQALQVFVGPLVDRWPVRSVLVSTQALQGVLVLVIPLAAWLGVLSVPLVLVVMPAVALLNQFVYPAQTAVLPRLVEREQLTAANSALSFAYQGTDMVFNGLAGLLVAAIGATALYLVDSVTFAAAVALFVGLHIPPAENPDDDAGADAADPDGGQSGYVTDLRAGFSFVRGTVLVWMFGTGIVANALLGATIAVLPAFAAARGGPGTYGLLMAGVSAGILVGALSAPRFDGVPFGRLSIGAFAAGAVAWFAALAAPSTTATVVVFSLAFVPIGVTNVVAAAMMQRLVPESLLGRVTALIGSASTAIMPLGSLLGGAAGDAFGAPAVMVAGGLGMLWIVVYVAAIPALRTLPPAVEAETLGPAGSTPDAGAEEPTGPADADANGETAGAD